MMGSLNYDISVAGVSFREHYPENLFELSRQMEGSFTNFAIVLKHEPENVHDANAVAVYVMHNILVGYIPKQPCWDFLRRHIREGGAYVASVLEVRINPDHPDRPGLTISVSLQGEK